MPPRLGVGLNLRRRGIVKRVVPFAGDEQVNVSPTVTAVLNQFPPTQKPPTALLEGAIGFEVMSLWIGIL